MALDMNLSLLEVGVVLDPSKCYCGCQYQISTPVERHYLFPHPLPNLTNNVRVTVFRNTTPRIRVALCQRFIETH